jgi:hypothetical protein
METYSYDTCWYSAKTKFYIIISLNLTVFTVKDLYVTSLWFNSEGILP